MTDTDTPVSPGDGGAVRTSQRRKRTRTGSTRCAPTSRRAAS